MKSSIVEIAGLKFYCRDGTSDEKSVREVVERDVYQKRGMQIVAGETWLDLGANIGAFSVLAASKGAKVVAFEPDPDSFDMLNRNLKLNALKATCHKKGVALTSGTSTFNQSATNQFWRNSMVNFGAGRGKIITIDITSLQPFLKKGVCVKMDIEGMEMPLLEQLDYSKLSKLVFEWSFDIDDNIDRYRKVVAKMEKIFKTVKSDSIKTEHKRWQKSWFPPCKNVYCYNG